MPLFTATALTFLKILDIFQKLVTSNLCMRKETNRQTKGAEMNFCDSCDRVAISEIYEGYWACESLLCEDLVADIAEAEA